MGFLMEQKADDESNHTNSRCLGGQGSCRDIRNLSFSLDTLFRQEPQPPGKFSSAARLKGPGLEVR